MLEIKQQQQQQWNSRATDWIFKKAYFSFLAKVIFNFVLFWLKYSFLITTNSWKLNINTLFPASPQIT